MNRPWIAALFVALLLPVALAAKETTDLRPIIDEQKALADTLAKTPGKLGLSTDNIDRVRRAQTDVFDAIGDRTRIDELSDRDQVKLKNALAAIGAAMQGTRAADEQQDVCWREKKMGSNITVTRCATKEEIRRVREGARDWKEKPGICGEGNPGCSNE